MDGDARSPAWSEVSGIRVESTPPTCRGGPGLQLQGDIEIPLRCRLSDVVQATQILSAPCPSITQLGERIRCSGYAKVKVENHELGLSVIRLDRRANNYPAAAARGVLQPVLHKRWQCLREGCCLFASQANIS